ncbi:methylenetetrahydrofolate--tRNA-(uracil(54)-C(5))-methyltransferase (FADH(2)-oxidizing) TrmFO [Myxococcus sp. MISCRS1]|jgi:methylenetetrahydrofolate--tRNA-(uracil-5-)-methyltransferase|uniref:methylenetetrahydrofolate--tRNA-(uracil(54)- C(5))-methyltransferase (FADH(2)-oxidizing) TrmFO n=1 Tax=Myxococcus TaxID=32 RepID=UPI001CBD63F2|nr:MULTISPECIES: methylenetetrahydrofolate--tRNA-(uracil(54)-C(5))-methyltransferase (FADH(2)-oxidizing) TrmFO [unclassified Myxococcus]MBZ4414263.1 methylenetetrahydrofolate--tRNA-(uracil(54)-C(5))-methyltransferase (FADH(2)-oxidizing) TrmFO [Myxococcus sp. XM-1-1-1]MCY0996026.1 methylenetetrahydrofolate--tRNA-(uracil(54)-C(5))-methyltransferase (FADH(2)-oxidizing) TrmFO [Myxococcus sp. MISCRS1]BDT33993.1 methylenetetrahydrofolate--tRNA-(uracil(54)-C(5))-methyltransferase (FADH(2)-oxidizing) Tr
MSDVKQRVTVIGGGLAGTECAYQLARRGVPVVLREMKPHKRSPAHKSDSLAELVCSNSLRSDNPESAIGLLHAELRDLGSVVLSSADAHRVPAGDALAVEREGFSQAITQALRNSGGVELVAGEVETLPEEGPVVVATGPLTSDALTRELERHVGQKLYFYDSIAPILSADSIDLTVAFRQSRYGKGGGDDYLNLPMNREEYYRFIAELKAGQKVVPHSFEEPKYFEGCLPIEVMAERGDDTLAYGPMKPVGLRDPRTGKEPHAVVQLRMEDRAGTAWNMVGFQTRLTWGEQKRIFTTCIPGLQNADFLRMGQIHRNTFIDSPRLLSSDLSLKSEPRVFFAGQVSGVEGYVESAACGYLVALALHARLSGKPWVPPPATTALGALFRHVTGEAHPPDYPHQPSNIIFGLFPPLTGRMKKAEKRVAYSARARTDLAAWLPHAGVPASGAPEHEEQRSA